MTPIVEISTDFATTAMAYIGQLFTDLTPLLLVVIGLPLGFWGVAKIIAVVRGGFRVRGGRA